MTRPIIYCGSNAQHELKLFESQKGKEVILVTRSRENEIFSAINETKYIIHF